MDNLRNLQSDELPKINPEVQSMPLQALQIEVMRLRAGIRLHRDQRGNDRCWLDDAELYKLLPEALEADFTLPPREEFLHNCARYFETRQPCPFSRKANQ